MLVSKAGKAEFLAKAPLAFTSLDTVVDNVYCEDYLAVTYQNPYYKNIFIINLLNINDLV